MNESPSIATRRHFVRALYEGRPVPEILDMLTGALARQRGFPAGCLPLHVACDLGAPAAIVKRLVKLYPRGASCGYFVNEGTPESSGAGDLPVFLACSQPSPCMETIKILIDAYPDCLRGSKQHVPLFHYCIRWGGSTQEQWLELIQYVLRRSSEMDIPILDTRDHNGHFPIHHLAQGSSIKLMMDWIQKMPDKILDKHLGNNHLLHFAVQDDLYTGHYPDMLEFLVDTFPEALVLANDKGELPIHLAQWPKDRDILLQGNPFTLLVAAGDGNTPIGRIQATMEDIKNVIRSESSATDQEGIILAETEEYRKEEQRLLTVLNDRVVPDIRHEVALAMRSYDGPEDVIDQILHYTIPHFNEAAKAGELQSTI